MVNEREWLLNPANQVTSFSVNIKQAWKQNATDKSLSEGTRTAWAVQRTAAQQPFMNYLQKREKLDAYRVAVDPKL